MKRAPIFALLAAFVLSWMATVPVRGAQPAPQKAPAKASKASPRQVIKRLDDALLATMKQAKKLGYEGRYRRLAPVIEQVFNFPGIAALTMGSYWTKLSAAQQREFIATLRDYTVATYASRFDGYSGERFAVKSAQSLQANVMVVHSTFTEADGKVHSFDYLMQPAAGEWRIVNVVADGVSDLALKQTEFTHLMKLKGFAGLIAGLKSYIARMAHAGEKK